MNIGERIKKVRNERQKTLLDVANVLGVSEATAQRYESGNIKNLKLDTIAKIANYLNVNPAYLMGWKDQKANHQLTSTYQFYPVSISAGVPLEVDGITNGDVEEITLPDSVMGKWAGSSDIYMMRVNGDSMNKVIPHESLIAIKSVDISQLKDGDIVVYSDDHDYSVKRIYDLGDKLVFKPDSTNKNFIDNLVSKDNPNLKIHGKVVVYIVEME